MNVSDLNYYHLLEWGNAIDFAYEKNLNHPNVMKLIIKFSTLSYTFDKEF